MVWWWVGKWKDCFMKLNITGSGDLMCGEIMDTVAFLTAGIAKEEASSGTKIKLVFGCEICGITKASECA